MEKLQEVYEYIKGLLVPEYVLIGAGVLLLIIIILLNIIAKKNRVIRSLEKAKAAALPEETVEAPLPVVTFSEDNEDIQSAKAYARALTERADRNFEEISRELDMEAQRTREFFQEQRNRAYEIVKEARERSERIVTAKPVIRQDAPAQKKAPENDPYNLGSLDDLD